MSGKELIKYCIETYFPHKKFPLCGLEQVFSLAQHDKGCLEFPFDLWFHYKQGRMKSQLTRPFRELILNKLHSSSSG